MTDRCPSTFYRTQCQLAADHIGNHYTRDSSGHTTTWTTAAADQDTPA